MSNESTIRPQAKPLGIVARLFPFVVIGIAAAVLLVVRFWPGTETAASSLSMTKMVTVPVALGLLLIWALRFSGWRRRNVWLVVLVGVVTVAGLFKLHSMDGRFSPIFVARDWVQDLFLGGSPDTVLERHRREQTTAGTASADLTEQPGDYPAFRGPARDGVVAGPALSRDWSAHPPKEIWRQPVGGGYAAFSMANGFLVTIEQRRDKEVVACYEAATGREVWTRAWDTRFTENAGGDGPRATPTISGGDVFALGAKGRLVCLAGRDGAEKWSVETLEGNNNIQWAMSGSPLVVGDLVIVNPGAQTEAAKGRAVRAYNRTTGKEVWAAGNNQAGYCSPQLATLGGHPQLLILDAVALSGHDLENGQELWRFSWPTFQGINVAQPIVVSDSTVFISAGYNVGGALVRVTRDGDRWTADEVWRTKTSVMRCKFASPVRRKDANGDFVYGLNDGILECVDLKTGKAVWKDDRKPKRGEAFGNGQILLNDDLMVVLTEYGELALAEATPAEFRELGRLLALTKGKKTWNTPAMAGGRIYVRNEEEMACYDLTGK